MKNSAIVRIVIWSLVAVIMCGLLMWGLRGNFGFGLRLPWIHVGSTGEYTSGEASFEAGEIDEVEVEWVSGRVTVQEGTKVSFSEESGRSLDEDEQLSYRVDGRKLVIQEYRRSFWFGSSPSKDLTLELPKELRGLKLSVVSADVTMSGDFTIDNLDLEGVSGRWNVSEVSCGEISLESVSGEMELTIGDMPREIDVDTVSGDVVLYLPENGGFTAEVDGVSGDLSTEFAVTTRHGRQVCGDGHTEIDGDTVSGDVILKKK